MKSTKMSLTAGAAPFRAHARLIRLLGEELISDEVMAVVELVKNCYDADAKRVLISLTGISYPETALIRIADDGSGMSIDALLHGWLEPANSMKRTRTGRKVRTSLGRVPLGEKGIGRFAVDKLGSDVELITRGIGLSSESVLEIKLNHYDHDMYLDEVENFWRTQEPLEFSDQDHGTILNIRNLRRVWDRDMVARLQEGLVRLVSPVTIDNNFEIELRCPDFPEFSGKVVNRLLESAPYQLSGSVNCQGIFTVETGISATIDLRELNREYFGGPDGVLREPTCGPFHITLNIWDLESTTGITPTVRKVIRSRSGMSIYRDNFRIWPYGERDDDWLELNQRRVNNPTLRVSNNQIIGFVGITHADNPELRDRTSREGLLENIAFTDLKALVLASLSLLENERFNRRRGLLSIPKENRKKSADPIMQLLAQLREGSTKKDDNGMLVREIENAYREKADKDRLRFKQVVRLAGVGMTAELITDTFEREVHTAMILLNTLAGISQFSADTEARELVQRVSERMDNISEQLDLMNVLYRPSLQDNGPVNVRGATHDVIKLLAHRIVQTGTTVDLQGGSNLTVNINRGYLMQVLMILVENSLNAMENNGNKPRCLQIEVIEEDGFGGLRLLDSGPGVSDDVRHLIFEPTFSTRQAGRGLGLSVARDILAVYSSSLELVKRDSSLAGACFEIRFDGRRLTRRPNR